MVDVYNGTRERGLTQASFFEELGQVMTSTGTASEVEIVVCLYEYTRRKQRHKLAGIESCKCARAFVRPLAEAFVCIFVFS
jgi:hypothetical protein